MATYSVSVYGDSELASITVVGPSGQGQSSGNRLVLQESDVLSVTHTNSSAIPSNAITVSPFSATYWTSTTDISVTRNNTQTRTVKTPISGTNAVNLTCSSTGYTSGTLYLSIVSSIDATPDAFSLGSDINGAVPGATYYFDLVTVSGINTTVSASCTNGEISLNGIDGWASSKTGISNGQKIYTRGTANASYGVDTTVTLTIGGVSDSVNIINQDTAPVSVRIPIGISSGTISINDLRQFFGPASSAAGLADYYVGGTYVPVATGGSPNNDGVPSSGTIALTDFYDSCTTIFFNSYTSSKYDYTQTAATGGPFVSNVFWNDNDWSLGYGPDTEDLVQYRFTHTSTNSFSSQTNTTWTFSCHDGDIDIDAQTDPFTTSWSSTGYNGYFLVEIEYDGLAEAIYSGNVEIEIRLGSHTAYTTSVTVSYSINLIGP